MRPTSPRSRGPADADTEGAAEAEETAEAQH